MSVSGSSFIQLENLPDKELATLCLGGDPPGWDEFFRRFTETIIAGAKRGLYLSGCPAQAVDDDVLWNIHEKVAVKLFRKGILANCPDLFFGIGRWLDSVSSNQARDWARAWRRKSRLAESDSTEGARSLDEPFGEAPGFSRHDTVPSPNRTESDPLFELRMFLESVLDTFPKISNDRIRWTVRLCILEVLPLSRKEKTELARFSGFQRKDAVARICAMENDLGERRRKREKELGTAVTLWHEMRNLERRVAEAERNPMTNPQRRPDWDAKIAEREAEIASWKAKISYDKRRREEILKSAETFLRPSNESIAAFLGLAEAQVQQVSQMFLRGRERLRKQYAKELVAVAGCGNG